MSTYQVWTKDPYGRNEVASVLSQKGKPETEWPTAEAALAAAKRFVHEKNCTTALTYDEQRKAAEYAVVELDKGIYAGDLVMARHIALVKIAAGDEREVRFDPEELQVKFYMGNNPDGQPWYLTNARKQPITQIGDSLLTDKNIVFVHKQREV